MTLPQLSDATWVAGLLALDGVRFGGAQVAEEAWDTFGKAYEAASGSALRVVPSALAPEALTGALDLASTLAVGKPVFTSGLLKPDDNASLVMRRTERLEQTCASLLAQALDAKSLTLVAIVDGHDPDAGIALKIEQRLAFAVFDTAEAYWTAEHVAACCLDYRAVVVDFAWVDELCKGALAVGITSPRAVLHALDAARGIAALLKRKTVDDQIIALATRLVLAHRAQYLPEPETAPEQDSAPPPQEPGESNTQSAKAEDAEVVLEAIKMAMPPHLLEQALAAQGKRGAGRNMQAASLKKSGGQRGKRIGHKRAGSLAGQRLDVLATLRNAAPWQPLRRKLVGMDRMVVTRDDFRVARIKQRNEATAIFAVDASGSTAFQRLAEAKGAVETILAECYVRRDRVALVVFRGKKAELLLPPTRSLERAKRALQGLPGGGGTPLASGLDEAFAVAMQVKRGGGNPIVILLTDGRANVTRDGEGNKIKAMEETLSAARLFAAQGFDGLLIDVSPEPQKTARAVAEAMGGRYLPMPRAGASDIAKPVRAALQLVAG
jgi:magnesium chelatase subunit D